MADCNKTEDFLRTVKRCCNAQCCYDCPICPSDEAAGVICIASIGETGLEHAETIIPALQRWADAHPPETWLQRLKKALPDCNAHSIVSQMCPGEFFSNGPGCADCTYEDMPSIVMGCEKCWNQVDPDEL